MPSGPVARAKRPGPVRGASAGLPREPIPRTQEGARVRHHRTRSPRIAFHPSRRPGIAGRERRPVVPARAVHHGRLAEVSGTRVGACRSRRGRRRGGWLGIVGDRERMNSRMVTRQANSQRRAASARPADQRESGQMVTSFGMRRRASPLVTGGTRYRREPGQLDTLISPLPSRNAAFTCWIWSAPWRRSCGHELRPPSSAPGRGSSGSPGR